MPPRKTKNITVVTGTRAEFGLLLPVIRAIDEHPSLNLRLLAAGLHLTTGTYKDILKSNYKIDAKIRMQQPGELGYAADVQSLSRGIASFGKDFASNPTDIVLVLGDRIEAFAAATAASIGGYRLAHIHGGDRAEGVADESMRHAITKLAHIHFPASKQSATRIKKLGEHASSIFMHGSPSIDDLSSSIHLIEKTYDLIFLQHPVGESDANEKRFAKQTLAAIHKLARLHNYNALILSPNHDPGAAGVHAAIEAFQNKYHSNSNYRFASHLPRQDFVSHLAVAKLILGNSSASLIEASALKTPSINIGPRQNGREKPRSVIDSPYGTAHILEAASHALSASFQKSLSRLRHPYGNGTAGLQIANTLANLFLADIPLKKQNTY